MAKHTFEYEIDITFHIKGETDEEWYEGFEPVAPDDFEQVVEQMREFVAAYDRGEGLNIPLGDVYSPCIEAGRGFLFDGKEVEYR